MKPKFLLIDGSITGFGGHHYQYAAHCLEAASAAGYDAYLATGAKNPDADRFPWKVVPAYRSGFWENDAYSARMHALYERFKKARFKAPVSLALRALGPLVLRRVLGGDGIERFAQDTRRLLSEVPLRDGDIAFVPTSGLTELLGAGEARGGGTWHFLFRRNIHDGSPRSYSFAYIKLRLLRAAFGRFLRRPGVRARFWTDSEQLTEEYAMVAPGFGTLPIPHTYPPSEPPAGPYTVSYLGDARSEKGYHLLPRAVGDLWESHVRTGRLRFVVQSNFNVPGGEPSAAVARAQLEQSASPGMLDLLTEPLDSDGYREALSSSSALLLPYDPQNYYARSSGICAEALAQGIPVAVPAGSWMSRQFAARAYEHQDGLRAGAPSESVSGGGLRFRLGEKRLSGPVRLGWGRPARACAPAASAPLLVAKVSFGPGNGAPSCRLCVSQRARGGQVLRDSSHVLEAGRPYATCALDLDERAALLKVSVFNDFYDSVLEMEDVSVSMVSGNRPRSAVGIMYDSPGQISACAAELADNADHYRATARDFSVRYRAKHNAPCLVRALEGA